MAPLLRWFHSVACKALILLVLVGNTLGSTAWGAIDVTSITPSYGLETGGTTITITGSGFKSGMEVFIGGVAVSSV